MRRAFGVLPLVLLFACSCFAQAQTPANPVKVKVRAALFDRDLNLKPVPRLAITFRNLDVPDQPPVAVQTNLDGVAELELPPATYKLTTDKSAELTGKAFLWDIEVKLLRPENLVELSNDNAKVTDVAGGRGARVDELAEQFKRVKSSVVTVWPEDYWGNGVLVDPAGLVLTSYSLVEGHDWIAVQFDETHQLLAELVAHDKAKDIAVLRVNLEPIKDAVFAQVSADSSALIEGERVFTVNSDVESGRMLKTGVISRASRDTIVSDLAAPSPGGPLFSSTGMLVGMGRVGESDNFVFTPVETAIATLNAAKEKIKTATPPSARLLPTYPLDHFPADALKARGATRWDKNVYWFKAGDFEVELVTPVALYDYNQQSYLESVKEHEKQLKKGKEPAAVKEPEHRYDPVFQIWAVPGTKLAFWKSFGDAMVTDGHAADTYRYKTSFVRMRLLCGAKEVTPIWPRRLVASGRVMRDWSGWQKAAVLKDSSYKGEYAYAHDAISPECGQVTLEISSPKDEKPVAKVLDPKIVQRIWADFEAYRKLHPGTRTSD